MKKIAIVAAKRTPIGAFQGQFSSVSAPELASIAIKATLDQANIKGEQIDEVILGNVISAGIGQAPARQAALGGEIPKSVGCTTLNKVCGSGMKALMFASDAIRAGSARIVLAGGMESMSNAPYLLPNARGGMRMGHQQTIDSMIHDGLWDPYHDMHMGNCGEICAEKYNFTREDQDAFALESLSRAQTAVNDGLFSNEIAPVTVSTRKQSNTFSNDEQPGLGKPEKIPILRPAFKKDGTITAANSASINDGAASLILASEESVVSLGLTPLAWITGYCGYSHEPEMFTTAPVYAIKKLLEQQNKSVSEMDLWEINEAFAVVTMAAMKDVGIEHDKVNIHGGATALGHPIGCSGARLVVTLLHALKKRGKQQGLASLCIGGGEATAMMIESA